MTRALRYFFHFWSEERNLKVLLWIVIINYFVWPSVMSLIGEKPVIHLINNLVYSLLLLAGVLALTRRKTVQAIFAVVVALIILVRWVRLIFGVTWLGGWDILLSLISSVTFVVVVLGHVYKEGPITSYRIQGAIVAYILIAMAFSMAYFLVEFLFPGSFRFPPGVMIIDGRSWTHFYYFSIVTLATLGYGDITPIHPIARNLVMVEALIGQLYPAILLARMVSLHVQTRGPKKDG